ncbi:hypothetical protein ACNQGI_02705 [Flavobacterium sp. LS2R12]
MNEQLKAETKLKGKRYYPESHLKYFSSEIMFDENKVLTLENRSMRNLIDCLVDRNSLASRLWEMDWSFFFTVAYKVERNKKSCFKQMHRMFEFLISKYGDDTSLRLFFTTEPFSNRAGFHNHFVIHVDSKILHEQIVNEIKNYFSYDRVDVSIYDRYKAGLFYVAKNGLVNEDWDVLGNNLGDNTINYEN